MHDSGNDKDRGNGGNYSEAPAEIQETKSKSHSRIKILKEKIETFEQELAALREQFLRKAAEFENYKKRRESEFIQLISNANAELLVKLLPVLDDLRRCLKSDQNSKDFDALFQGVELIYKKLYKILEDQGLKPIEAIGQPFDPEKHSALLQIDSSEHPPGTVVEEHVRGYTMNGRVLRHSQVIVSK
jgi:molecular chaperone GrpE